MRDPVTGFVYPPGWIAKCTDPAGLARVGQGFAVLTASGTVLLRGYTTGTTAAAACKAAVLSLDRGIDRVSVRLPCGLVAEVPVTARAGRAFAKKYSGDYPSDVTAGIEFVATAVPAPEGIRLVPGAGIGRFVRDTPRYKKGAPAISEAPLACILAGMEEALAGTGRAGATVTLEIPDGERVGNLTLNPKIGVKGGISVLGTTGLVEPWDDHLEESVQARVAGAENPVITTGRIGLRYSRLLFPDREVVLAGGKIKEALAAAGSSVILCGLPALILKYIEPDILVRTGYATVEELAASPDFKKIAGRALRAYKARSPQVRVVLVNRDGEIIGESP
jgi:cobalt-precorrin-5B (C1)-methyltransferase